MTQHQAGNDERTPQAEAPTNSASGFEAWSRSEAQALPHWWPDGERGEQAAAFFAQAVTAAWEEGFHDERVRYKSSAWRHSMASRWAFAAAQSGRRGGEQA